MKKILIFTVAIILCFSLAACGRRDKAPVTTEPRATTSPLPGMDPTILDPTFETNIPDPGVNSTMPSIIPDMSIPDFTDGSDPTATYKEDMK
ncbi:MAG: hypothetical protein IKU07_07055 [Oscillospiraceae bacterium]|nr:hypothetical protein [Oscillospiraceae bacterium]